MKLLQPDALAGCVLARSDGEGVRVRRGWAVLRVWSCRHSVSDRSIQDCLLRRQASVRTHTLHTGDHPATTPLLTAIFFDTHSVH